MILSYADKRSETFATGGFVSAFQGFAQQAERRLAILDAATSLDDLRALVHVVDVFSQAAAILDARDPEAVRRLAYDTHRDFSDRFVAPAAARRQAFLDAGEAVPHDILTVLLQHASDPALELDEGRIVREVGTYLQGGTHTSAQSLTNALDLIFAEPDGGRPILQRVGADLAFAQRVVLETLRLRPTTPKMKRRAEAGTVVVGVAVPKDALVVLDAETANRDTTLFGADAAEFNPDRVLDPGLPRWGLAFGAGPHQCPGRSVAGGFPPPGDPAQGVDEDHIHGLVALMLQAVAQRGVAPEPEAQPQRDTRTERTTRWHSYPVRFGS